MNPKVYDSKVFLKVNYGSCVLGQVSDTVSYCNVSFFLCLFFSDDLCSISGRTVDVAGESHVIEVSLYI